MSRFVKHFTSAVAVSPIASAQHDYLIGLRGTIVVQSFLFVFFQTFLPTALPDSKNVDGPSYQEILRKSFSVIFCNEALIYSWIIILSARMICIPYLTHNGSEVCASSIFRRAIRLVLPTFIGYSFAAAAFSTTSTEYIGDFLSRIGNISATRPLRMNNFLVYFNSLFELFWVNKEYSSQAANKAFPSGTLWIVSLLFQQSYTLFMTMIVVPYTRISWRVQGFLVFIVAAFWVQSWAWYSITGLLMADAVLNMNFQQRSKTGVSLARFKIPIWPLYATMVLTGFLLQFLFISWKPSLRDNELYGHSALYGDGVWNEDLDQDQPLARIDNYLTIIGTMMLIETFEWPRKLLSSRFFVALGRRSFSVFLIQGLIIYTAGIKVYLHMDASNNSSPALNTFGCFCACVPVVILASEVFYRVVDIPSVIVARKFWGWMTK